MSKDIILSSYGYYDLELTVHNLTAKLHKNTFFYEREHKAEYQICYVKNGNPEFWCKDKFYYLEPGDVFVAKPYEEYKVRGKTADDYINIMFISFSQSIFKNVKGDENYLRVFDKREKGMFNLYKKNNFIEFSIEKSIINPFLKYISLNLGLIHFLSGLCTFITQLDIAFDKLNLSPSSTNSSEYEVKVYDYITSNCMTNITSKEVCDKFNVSKWYLDKVTNRFYGMPFYKTIKSLRMWNAKTLMIYKKNLLEISKICGYSDYSAFYRSYISFFGISPKKDFDYFKENKVFLSDQKNNTFTRY